MLTIIIILAILSSIGIGYWLNINIGLLAMGFAYIISVLVMGLSSKELLGFWPINLFFIIFAITFFFGFAISNGTLDKVSHRTVYMARRMPAMIPFALYGLVMLISGVGPGHYAVFVFLSPLVMSVAARTGMSRVLGAIIIVCGGMATTFVPISMGGRVTQGILENAGYDVVTAANHTHVLLIDAFVVNTVMFLAAYVLLKGYRTRHLDSEPPEPLDPAQRRTLALILAVIAAIVLPSVLAAAMPSVALLGTIASRMDATFVSIIGIVLALVLRVGNEKDALAKVPWAIIVLLCGMGMLIAVAVKAGTISALSQWLATHVSATNVPYATGISASLMSFFSSTLGVVMPTLFPMAPSLAAQTGTSETLLLAVIMLCASMTGFSPFSSAGALALAGVQSEAERGRLFFQLLLLPFIGVSCVLLLVFFRLIG